MPDAISLAMVTQSALPAAFTFVFQQVDSLIGRWRGRREAPAESTGQVPAELVGALALPLTPDAIRLEARAGELEAYLLALSRYREDPSLITTSDAVLMAMLSRARDALEEIYGQRITFRGEQRLRSGPFTAGRYKEVAGELVGMEANEAIRGEVTVDLDIDVIQPGGKVVGMTAPVIEDRN
ncbi:hypothetical protein [Streptomyces aureoversilis]|uniref:Uncharacterized protein n=1 Tax=Streptomyces aureoversilis TaxID=67277 RepID=A0ABW0A0D1_9ACTN